MSTPTFPPQMWGHEVTGVTNPFDVACGKAALGCDAGLVAFNLAADKMGAAMVFAPEVPLSKAVAMLPLCGVGMQNALGALSPPEVAVHLEWSGAMRINGARCGGFKMAASANDPAKEPAWLVVGFELPLIMAMENPGEAKDQTALFAEGCADVEPPRLLESWARHSLNWIARWEAEGTAPLHSEWRGLAHGIGEDTVFEGMRGSFLGVDEDFGMLLRDEESTHLIPLTRLLED